MNCGFLAFWQYAFLALSINISFLDYSLDTSGTAG